MELFLPVLQGSYGYLLIFQILVVAPLSMLLLWLVVQRTRQGAHDLVMRGDGAVAVPTTSVGSAPSTGAFGNLDLEKRCHELEQEIEQLRSAAPPSAADLKPLQDKIKFLE